MALYSNLASLSQTAASNAADGSVDAPSTIDQQTNLLASFIAQLRDGVGFTGIGQGRLIGVQTFLASGTYTPTTGTTKIIVKGQGSGGGGGGATGTAAGQVSIGSGGGAGAIGETLITSGFSGTTVTIGTGGVSVSGAAGGNGTATTFGSFLSLTGGVGGATANTGAVVVVAGAIGGTATLGNIYLQPGQQSSSGGASNAQGYACGTAGANSLYGGGGLPGAVGTGVAAISAGSTAAGRGAGGGGAAAVSGSGAVGGGAGTNGILVVYEFA
jgi:hypothetical protein